MTDNPNPSCSKNRKEKEKEKKSKIKMKRKNKIKSTVNDLDILSIPLLIKPMLPKRTCIAICLILVFAVDILEEVSTMLFFFYFKSWGLVLKFAL